MIVDFPLKNVVWMLDVMISTDTVGFTRPAS